MSRDQWPFAQIPRDLLNPRTPQLIESKSADVLGYSFLRELDAYLVGGSFESATRLCESLINLNVPLFSVAHPQFDIYQRLTALFADKVFRDAASSMSFKATDPVDSLAERAVRVMYSNSASPVSYLPAIQLDDRFSKKEMEIGYDQGNDAALKMMRAQGFYHIYKIATLAAPLSVVRGGSVDVIADNLVTALTVASDRFCTDTPKSQREMACRSLLIQFLASFPDAWPRYGITADQYLGEPMVDQDGKYRHEVARGKAGKSMIRAPGRGFPDSRSTVALDYFAAIDPSILNGAHILRDGSRTRCWSRKATNVESAVEQIRLLALHGIRHPALHGLKVTDFLDKETASQILCDYVSHGGEFRKRISAWAIDQYPDLKLMAFERCRGHAQLSRLDEIAPLTPEQLGSKNCLLKGRFLVANLDI